MADYDVIPLILAAGKGVRMKSEYPKVSLEICGRPMIRRIVEIAKTVSSEKPCVVVGSGADFVRESLEGVSVHWIYQREQLGTGHAVKQAEKELAESGKNVLILCGDTPLLRSETLAQLIEHHRSSNSAATLVSAVLEDPRGYGRIVRSQHSGAFVGIIEDRDCKEHERRIKEINAGLYLIDAKVLFETLSQIDSENDQGEFYLTDVFGLLSDSGVSVDVLNLSLEEELLGVNDRKQLALASKILRRRCCDRLMEAGVTLEDPDSIHIDDDVEIGRDSYIEPNVHILAASKLGKSCRVATGSHISDCEIGDNVQIRPYTVASSARVGSDVILGPFCHLREGTVLEEKSKVGNYVELKKTRLGRASKASHLAYLGDSEIGSDVNIGAGTITCNYDGIKKNPTEIGDQVFVGSNSTLVAPLKLSKRCYVAAGSTINKDVDSEDLAIARCRQENKKGYRKRIERRIRGAKK